MQWKHSITSASNLGGYSVGALLTGSTTQWDLERLSQGANEIELQWSGETSTGDFQHTMVVRTTACPPQYDRAVFVRALCHYLLTKLPDEGLPDVCRSLVDAYEYYFQFPKALKTYEVQRFQPVKAKAGRTYERPAFPISEE